MITGVPASQAQDTESQIDWIDVTLETPGSLGVELLYKVDQLSDVKNLRVSGTFSAEDWTTIKNLSAIVNLDLTNVIATAIPDAEFSGRTSLKSIQLPATLTYIGNSAFYNATGLTEIILPEKVTSIGESCFNGCSSLTRFESKALSSLPYRTFYGCTSMRECVLNEGITYLGQHCFYNCTKLVSINLPSTLRTIDHSCFSECKSLTDVVIPDGVSSLGEKAFSGANLNKITLPSRASLGSYLFYYCQNLEEVVLPCTLTQIPGYLFASCTKLKKIVLPAAVPPTVGTYAFNSMNVGVVTLVVPSFAVVNYKLDSFYIKFGKIEGGADSDSWTIKGTLSLTNDRRMTGTPDVEILDGGIFVFGGATPQNLSNLKFSNSLLSTPYSYSQLINNSSSLFSDNLEFNINCYGGKWYYITFPCDIKRSDIVHESNSDFVIRYYDGESRALKGASGNWKDVPADGILEAGRGYIYQSYSNGIVSASAENEAIGKFLKSGDRVVTAKAWVTENSANAGWNLLGNPFMSYYDLSATSLSCPVTLWNHSNSRYDAYSLIDDHVVLAPLQTFFMQQPDEDAEIVFTTDGCAMTSAGITRFAATRASLENSERFIFDIEIADNDESATDHTRVVINNSASLEYETSCDAAKFFSEDFDLPMIYTIDASGNKLAINERPIEEGSVKLGVYVPKAGSYTISGSRLGGNATLEDLFADKRIALDHNTFYTFRAEKAGNIDDRFLLHLNMNTTAVESIANDVNLKVTTTSGSITISGTNGKPVMVYAGDGRIVALLNNAEDSVSLNVESGIYIVKCHGKSVKCIVK